MEHTVEQVTELGGVLVRLSERISMLERDASFITDSLSLREKNLSDITSEMDEQLAEINSSIKVVETTLKNALITFDLLVAKLKETAQKSSVERVSERVDNWNPEGFVTKYELKESLKE